MILTNPALRTEVESQIADMLRNAGIAWIEIRYNTGTVQDMLPDEAATTFLNIVASSMESDNGDSDSVQSGDVAGNLYEIG